MDSYLILLCLFVFVEGSTAVVSLRSNQTEIVLQSGQSLTFHCELDTSRHHTDCEVKTDTLLCECCSKQLNCSQKPALIKGTTQPLSVEVYNVTIEGTCTIALDTTCGEGYVTYSINVTKTHSIAAGAISQLETKSYIVIGIAVAFVTLVAVAIIAVILRKRRRDKSTTAERQGEPAYGTNLLTTL